MKEEWLFRGALVPIDAATTAALVAEIKRLIDVVGGMALAQPEQGPVAELAGVAYVDDLDLWHFYPLRETDNFPDGTKFYTTPPKQEPHNFCPRCGKRLIGMAFAAGGVHTCTPPLWGYK